MLTLAVNVSDTTGIYGGSFDLVYNRSLARFSNWSTGSLLEQNGHTPLYQVDASQPGRLIVVATRTGDVGVVSATGDVPLIRLVFEMTAPGTSTVSFGGSPGLFDDQQPTPQPLPGINWFGGSFTAN
jgi:hypothetical protein